MKELRAIRKARGLSVTVCARAVGDRLDKVISDAKWERWERQETDPNSEERNAIADYFGVTLDQLAGRAPLPTAHVAS